MLQRRIIDAHSHIGIDRFWGIPADLAQYLDCASRLGITDSILMPTTCPVIETNQEKVTQALWEYSNNKFIYYKEIIGKEKLKVKQNPFEIVNQLLFQTISKYQNNEIKLYFVPVVHPVLDTIEYLEQLINYYKPIALKIHGIATAISPSDISKDFWDTIRKFNIPLIVHTDIDKSGQDTPIAKLRNLNSPLNWIQVLQENNVKAYLAHGVRLCPESFEIINKSNNFVVGLGPDALISTEKERIVLDEPYLYKLFSSVNLDKICFDLDYSWNVVNGELEWNSLSRIEALGLTNLELNKVLCNNVLNFYKG